MPTRLTHALLLLALALAATACASEPERRTDQHPAGMATADEARADEGVPFVLDLGYAPLAAERLDLIQDSDFALTDGELSVLGQQGLVIARQRQWTTFTYGYEALYHADLPVFVSADSVLHALHRSYDEILIDLEQNTLIPELDAMLREMRRTLADGALTEISAEARADADLILAVALSLLSGGQAVPVAGADPALIDELVAAAVAGQGVWRGELFGFERDVDASQFTPRGHYTRSPVLSRYFQAMMWLGRVDLRPIDTLPDGTQVVLRRQLDAAMGLTALLQGETFARWRRHDETIRVFVGESDNMTPLDAVRLREELGASTLAEWNALADEVIVRRLVEGEYGAQRIASHLRATLGVRQNPLPSSFRLLGQRFILDSYVFSNLTYDRLVLPGGEGDQRFMPSPLDVAYAVLGNDHARTLLADELARTPYGDALGAQRDGVDALGAQAWQRNLYTLWLGALRTLSPRADEMADPAAAGLPRIATTEAWARRTLNTQLASWAELRHDTLLYAKQSYSAAIICEYPDFYVEPNPELFAALEAYAALGHDQVARLASEGVALSPRLEPYFANLAEVSGVLRTMAERQRRGEPHTDEELAFINRMVREQRPNGCGTLVVQTPGWYQALFYTSYSATQSEPTIADVHTDGHHMQVLHVATGLPRMMVVTVDTCEGPRAYAGLVSSYHEVVTDGLQRLTDDEWSGMLREGKAAEVWWMEGLVE